MIKILFVFLILVFLLINIDYKKSYSQINQDIDLLRYLKRKRNGYFIDIGAHDGIRLSNTYLLEKKFNWKGICVEPQNNSYEKLKKNRSCYVDNSLLYSKKGLSLDFSNANMLGGITKNIDTHEIAKEAKKDTKITSTLNDILIKHSAPSNIDFMSLDTEGSELEILKGIDFNKYKFKFIALEHNNIEPRRSDMKKLLESNGYKHYKKNRHDDYYILK
jgi:FkbM family methyltransferase